jgi:hypothetical protein
MNRIELTALCSTQLRWEMLVSELPPTLESLGLVHDDGATDGEIAVQDRGDDGCVLLLGHVALARRAARALATRLQVAVTLFEVVGSRGTKRFRFKTTAWRATAAGGLVPADGVELDLEDPEETWGGGTLDVQAGRVLDLFADLHGLPKQTIALGYRRRAQARPSTPRVATLLGSIQKAKSYEAAVQADGRVALRLELATGGTQTSFCSAAEHEELETLLAGKAPRS